MESNVQFARIKLAFMESNVQFARIQLAFMESNVQFARIFQSWFGVDFRVVLELC